MLAVDTFNIRPNYDLSLPNMNNESGVIPLKNGIKLSYDLTGTGPDSSNSIIYNYTLTIEIDMVIELIKKDSGHVQSYDTRYDFPLYINTTTNDPELAKTRINQFLFENTNSLKSILSSYCVGG